MTQQTKQSTRAFALIFVAGMAVFSILPGLFLIFSPDPGLKAQRLADAGAALLIEAEGAENEDELLQQAYKAHLNSVRLLPYNSDLWVRLAYAANALEGGHEKASSALNIASALDPTLDIAAHKHKLRKKAEMQ